MAAIGILFLVVSNGIKSAFFRYLLPLQQPPPIPPMPPNSRAWGEPAQTNDRDTPRWARGASLPTATQADDLRYRRGCAATGAGGGRRRGRQREPASAPSAGRGGRLCSVSLRVRRAASAVSAAGNFTRSTVHPLLIAYLNFFLRSTQRKSRTACPCRVRSMLKKKCSRNICRKHRAKIKVSVL